VITDFELVDAVLSAVERVAQMAVLHRERDVAEHAVESDVDVCIDEDALAVVSAAGPCLEAAGVMPILVFHYDRGSYSFFFSNEAGSGGAQIDFLHDPRGAGRYGVRTDELLRNSSSGVRWPRIDRLDETLYVLRKAQVKRDRTRVASAREEALAHGVERASRRAREIFAPRAVAAVSAALAGYESPRLRAPSLWRSRLMRPSRVFHRCGFWAHLSGDSASWKASDLSERMSHLIASRTAVDPSLSFLLRNLWRPRLVVSVGQRKTWLRPDAVIPATAGEGSDELTSQLVVSMRRKVFSTLKLESGVN